MWKLSSNESFFEKVYEIVRLIPVGRVSTYGAIAKYIGSPQSARMVGWALNSTKHVIDFIPAHRVVNRNGRLSGKTHFRHPDLMKELLESEGIKVENDQVQLFSDVFWDPYKELD